MQEINVIKLSKRVILFLMLGLMVSSVRAEVPLRGFADAGFDYKNTSGSGKNQFYHGQVDLFDRAIVVLRCGILRDQERRREKHSCREQDHYTNWFSKMIHGEALRNDPQL